jgi:[acyl-carrier-protein] S-malonyltransferase
VKILLLFGGQGVGDSNLYDLLHGDKEGDAFLSRASEIANTNLLHEIIKIRDPHDSQLLIGIFQLGVFSILRHILGASEISVAGYSLGEVPAFLSSINASLEECVEVLKYRTQLMTSLFIKEKEGTYDLLSIKGRFGFEEIESLCFKYHCEIAIINAENRLIIGGKVSDLQNMLSHSEEFRIDHYKFLAVYEPSHTSYYRTHSEKFTEFLKSKFSESSLRYPIISPIKQRKIDDIHEEIILLGQELSTRLHWDKVCQLIPEYGYELIIDLGPGSAMTFFLKGSGARLYNQKIVTIANFRTLEGVREYVGAFLA